MTEEEWLSTSCSRPMLESLGGAVSERKLRLFASACCRRLWHLLTDERCRESVETAERFVDGSGTSAELDESRAAVSLIDVLAPDVTFFHRCAVRATGWAVTREALNAAAMAAESATAALAEVIPDESAVQAALLRDIIGNPFRKVKFDPAWRTDTAVALARQVYDSRDFGAMPILADALQDAGCVSADILTHCRDAQQVHVRGCWVVDLVLGKS